MKQLHLLLLSLALLPALPSLARDFTYTYEGKTLMYTVIDEEAKTCKTKDGGDRVAGNEVSGDLRIPAIAKDGDSEYTVTSIGDYAFYDCYSLSSVSIPNTVTTIGEWAFAYIRAMDSVTLPNSVTSIGRYAFQNSRLLTSVTIPSSVTFIGRAAFFDCQRLTAVNITDLESWCQIDFEGESANPLSYANHLYLNDEEVTSIEFPETVTSICNYAFYGCTGLTSVTIPNSVSFIGRAAFKQCLNITSVTIPNSITEISDSAFAFCNGMTSLTLPDTVTVIGKDSFYYCSGLTSLTIPTSVTIIGDGAFGVCEGLTSLTIPNSVTSIGVSAFANCSGLISLTIPNSVTSIQIEAFDDCENLVEVNYDTTEPVFGAESIFSDVTYRKATLYVAIGGLDRASLSHPWRFFSNIKEKDFSGIEDVLGEIDPNVPVEVYDLSGVKVANTLETLPSGIYIVRQGNTAKRMIVK